MTQAAEALYTFFSSFGLPAYVEDTVPDSQPPSYITYQLIVPDWRSGTPMYARIWYRSTSFVEINAKVDELAGAIGEGVCLPTDSGAVWLYKGQPFAQVMPMTGDPMLRVVYLNLTIHANTD